MTELRLEGHEIETRRVVRSGREVIALLEAKSPHAVGLTVEAQPVISRILEGITNSRCEVVRSVLGPGQHLEVRVPAAV